MKKIKTFQRHSKVSFYVPIDQHFLIKILKLTSSCRFYHNCQWLWYLCHAWIKIFYGNDWPVNAIFSVDYVPNGVYGIFLTHLPNFMKKMVWFEKTETKDLVKGLDEFTQKLDVIAAVIFTLIDVISEFASKQQQPCYFCYDHFLDSD